MKQIYNILARPPLQSQYDFDFIINKPPQNLDLFAAFPEGDASLKRGFAN